MKNIFLKAEGLKKYFGEAETEVKAVDGISISVVMGEIILIMGPSGSGKTTLLTLLGALISPTSGKVFYKNNNITKVPRKILPEIRLKNIGFIFQNFNLLSNLTALENVQYIFELRGIKGKEARKKAEKLLIDLKLGKRLNHNPKSLSGGEKQRVSIARALAAEPKIILADEPTANLDSTSGHKVMEILRNIAKKENRAVVIVSHDERIMDIADRILWLEDGKIIEGKVRLVFDPVCEMNLKPDQAPFNYKYKGETYYFCGQKCLNSFKEKPDKYLS